MQVRSKNRDRVCKKLKLYPSYSWFHLEEDLVVNEVLQVVNEVLQVRDCKKIAFSPLKNRKGEYFEIDTSPLQ